MEREVRERVVAEWERVWQSVRESEEACERDSEIGRGRVSEWEGGHRSEKDIVKG